jgi:hypothetical protein
MTRLTAVNILLTTPLGLRQISDNLQEYNYEEIISLRDGSIISPGILL